MPKELDKYTALGAHGSLYSVENDLLHIIIPLTKEALAGARPSASGKTRLVASTGGFVPVPNTAVKVSLNVSTK